MNARSVFKSKNTSKCAARKPGLTLTMILLLAGIPLKAAETTITVKGTLNGGPDTFNIFGMGKAMPKGTPYTIIFTFDDTRGGMMPVRCPKSGTRIVGVGRTSPGIAVLTINGKSFEFGRKPDARSRAWRSTPTSCSQSEIGIAVQEGPASLTTGLQILIRPNMGQKPLTSNGDWRGSVSLSNFDARNGDNAFSIRKVWDYRNETMSYLSVDSVVVRGK